MREAVIVDAFRTARGKKKDGVFTDAHPMDLAAHVLRGTVEKLGVEPAVVDDVVLDCVTQVGEQS